MAQEPDITADRRWEAVLHRTPAADGQFYYGVTSTGIYCRPSCPSRRPAREKVRFFETATEAETAGFRACKRCRPAEPPGQAQAVARARQLLEEAEAPLSLGELAAAVGMSPTYLQRLFKRATGLSPREYAAAVRAERLRAELKQGARVTEALYEAGYGSARALYEEAPRHLGMSPGTYRSGGAGEEIGYTCAETSLGRVLVAATERGVCALRFGESDAALVAELRTEFPRAALRLDPGTLADYVHAVQTYLGGGWGDLDLPVDLKGSAFRQKVWGALRTIPRGEVRSYGEVAAQIGQPTAVRAVASACAANPVALVVPCHRVLRTGGALSGYRWGVERKRALLEGEGALQARH